MINRKEFDEILAKLQSIDIYTLEDESDVLVEIYDKRGFDIIEDGLNVDKHRWYELTTQILKFGNWFISMRWISQMYSESNDYYDIGIYAKFKEVLRFEKVVYEYLEVDKKVLDFKDMIW